MNNNKKIITKFYKILLSFFILGFLLYNLFIKHFFFININSFMLQSVVFISLLLQLSYVSRSFNVKFNIIINKMLNKFYNAFYWEPLIYIYNNFLQKIPGLGTSLYPLGKYFVTFCIKLGNKATVILCFSFHVLPHVLILSSLVYNNFFIIFPNKFIYFLIATSFIILRLTSFLIFLLNDFSKKNMQFLDKFLIVTKIDKAYKYDFNYNTIKNPTQEKLKLYSTRYVLFREIEIFTSAFTFYKNNIINKMLKPYIIATFFICTIKLCLIIVNIQMNSLIFFIIFFITIFLEFRQNDKN